MTPELQRLADQRAVRGGAGADAEGIDFVQPRDRRERVAREMTRDAKLAGDHLGLARPAIH